MAYFNSLKQERLDLEQRNKDIESARERFYQQKLLEEKNKKASKINQNLSNLIKKMKKDFNIEDEQF